MNCPAETESVADVIRRLERHFREPTRDDPLWAGRQLTLCDITLAEWRLLSAELVRLRNVEAAYSALGPLYKHQQSGEPASNPAEKERASFERWLGDEQGLPASEWDVARNCYVDLPCHIAWKAWCAGRRATEPRAAQDNTCRRCYGSGTIEVQDEAGPNAHPMDVDCPVCAGTGAERTAPETRALPDHIRRALTEYAERQERIAAESEKANPDNPYAGLMNAEIADDVRKFLGQQPPASTEGA